MTVAAPAIDANSTTVGLARRWIRALVVGELIGFLPPAIVGAALASADVGDAAP